MYRKKLVVRLGVQRTTEGTEYAEVREIESYTFECNLDAGEGC